MPTAAVKSPDSLPVKVFRDGNAWEDWLAKHSDSAPGVWIRMAKKSSGLKSVSLSEALDTALCYGWIDGLRKSLDDETFLQRYTPRGVRSVWSKINRAKALELIDQGRMKPSGLAAIEQAKKNGRWASAYDSYRTATLPAELRKALDRKPRAKAFFEKLSRQNRYAILFRIQTAKKSETRAKRIREFVGMLERGETLHPQSKRD